MSTNPDSSHDEKDAEIQRLNLLLHHAQIQRDHFKAALEKEVQAVIHKCIVDLLKGRLP
jgi:hypothetical protein